jgi:hypothetical protein
MSMQVTLGGGVRPFTFRRVSSALVSTRDPRTNIRRAQETDRWNPWGFLVLVVVLVAVVVGLALLSTV